MVLPLPLSPTRATSLPAGMVRSRPSCGGFSNRVACDYVMAVLCDAVLILGAGEVQAVLRGVSNCIILLEHGKLCNGLMHINDHSGDLVWPRSCFAAQAQAASAAGGRASRGFQSQMPDLRVPRPPPAPASTRA